MPRLEKIEVELALPFVGKVTGTWVPTLAERQAAWELYIELVTRTTVTPLPADGGSIREALSSFHSIFPTTREILRRHGPVLARPTSVGTLSFGLIAVDVLNGVLRPILTQWHPALTAYEGRRPSGTDPIAWERSWSEAKILRADLERCRAPLTAYADLLAEAAKVHHLHG